MLLLLALLTCSDSCVVVDRARCCPSLAVFEELQCTFPTPALRTSADGCIETDRVRPYLLNSHGLQKSNCMPPLSSFLTRRHGCVEADDVQCRPNLTVF